MADGTARSGSTPDARRRFTERGRHVKVRWRLLLAWTRRGAMPSPSVRVFLSCVSSEFGAYRDALRRALTRPNVEVKIQEDFKALGGDTLNMLAEYVEQCEAIVHFVGDMVGSTPAASSVDDLLKR